MEAECAVELVEEVAGESSDDRTDPVHGDRADLFSLGLRIVREVGSTRREQDLERVDAIDVGRHGYDGHDTTPELLCGSICTVVAHDHRRSTLPCLVPTSRIEIDPHDVPASHQRAVFSSPSASTAAQSSPSDAAHSAHAAA